MRKAHLSAASPVSRRSWVGLNAANFFLAEMMGVVMPFLGKYLKGQGWSETALGVAISAAGLGVFLTQTPAGLITDRVRQRRALLAGASLLVGICFGLAGAGTRQFACSGSRARSPTASCAGYCSAPRC